MNKRFCIIAFIVLTFSLNSFGNWQARVDSLKALITIESPDSTKVRLHTEIADELFLNKPEKAYEHILEVVAIAERNADSSLLYEGYISLSYYFSMMNDYQSALEYIYEAFNLSENNTAQMASCHSRLADAFYFTDDMDKSIYHTRLSLTINTKLGDTLQMIYNLHDIGMWHLEYDNYDSALFYIYKARAYYNNIDKHPLPLLESHLGQIYTYMNLFDSALHYHFEALRLDSLSDSQYEITIDENYISNTYLRKKNYEKAIYYANKSMEHSKELELLDVIRDNYELLYKSYEEKGDFKKALEYSLLRNDYADSLRDKNKESIIQGLNAKFSFNEQHQKLQSQAAENTLLRKKKTLLMFLSVVSLLFLSSTLIIIIQIYQKNKVNRIMLKELEKSNNAKEKMISVISHDLRGSVGTLRNSVQMIIDESLDFEATKELLVSFFPVVDSTYDLLENLLTWANYSKESLEPSFERFHIIPIIEKSIQHTHHLAESKNIEIVNKVEDAIVTADKNMLSTIVRNLISNAVKFSHPKSKVTITSMAINNSISEITIIDEGIGMKPEVLNQIFIRPTDYHSKGTCGERGSGLGLAMCKTFIEKQGGKIWAKSKLGKGSSFSFTIPVVQKN